MDFWQKLCRCLCNVHLWQFIHKHEITKKSQPFTYATDFAFLEYTIVVNTLNSVLHRHRKTIFNFSYESFQFLTNMMGVKGGLMVISKTILLPFHIKCADTFWTRFKGRVGPKGPLVDKGLLLTPCNSLRMFFIRHPIDVIFLNKSNRVIKTISYRRPWRVIPPVKNAEATLILPLGTVKKEKVRVDDTLQFNFSNHNKT